MSDPPPIPELIIMNAEFTPDELAELILQLDYARQLHNQHAEQYDRWYRATGDTQTMELRNRSRARADKCQHVMNKSQAILMRKVTEHASTEEHSGERNDQHDSREVQRHGNGQLQRPDGPGEHIGLH